MALQVSDTSIHDAKLITVDVFHDERGYFKETFSTKKYEEIGIADTFVQDSFSSSKKNVLRGLHGDNRMAKLVQVLHGNIWDVIVDARKDSPTFGCSQGFLLSDHAHQQLYIPAGCLHGFIALSDNVLFLYKLTSLYQPGSEFGIRWDDPDLALPWPLDGVPIVSDKDQVHPYFSSLSS